MSEPLMGTIIQFAGNFAPRGWAFCNGQLLNISQYSALYAILGITFGGDGKTTFALPDLRGRVPIHPGQGPGLSSHVLGEQGGVEQVTLTTSQMPAHNHPIPANTAPSTAAPANSVIASAKDINGETVQSFNMTSNAAISPTSPAGGSQPHQNMQPYLAINFIIALTGIFPSRN